MFGTDSAVVVVFVEAVEVDVLGGEVRVVLRLSIGAGHFSRDRCSGSVVCVPSGNWGGDMVHRVLGSRVSKWDAFWSDVCCGEWL